MARKNKLREVERSVLSKLEADSRQPLSRIGKGIRRSQQQVSYTVNSLIEKGVIQNFDTLIDYSKLDIINFRVFFKISYSSQEKFDELIRHIDSDPHISHLVTCGGRYDLICTFFALNPSQFNKTLKDILSKFPKQIQDYDVLTTIVVRWFSRKYICRDLPKEIILGGDRMPEIIDEIDMKILNELSKDGRTCSVKIAELISVTPKTVMQRIKKLRSKEVILGFKPLLNPRKMGYVSNLLLIKYHNITPEMEKEMINYLKIHLNVVGAVKTLGEWDLEIRIETQGTMEFRKVEMEIRQKFTLLIQQIEGIPLYRIYKNNYFPKFLIKG